MSKQSVWSPQHKLHVVNGFVTCPNGLNFRKSLTNPNSNLMKVCNYLGLKGYATKQQILKDVFGVTMCYYKNYYPSHVAGSNRVPPGEVRHHAWGANMFRLAVKLGLLKHSRMGKTVLWALGPNYYRRFNQILM